MDFTFTADQVQLRQRARDFAEKEIAPLAEELDAAYDYHPEGMKRIKRSGLYAYVVPEAFGGKGISSVNLCIVREDRPRRSESRSSSTIAPSPCFVPRP